MRAASNPRNRRLPIPVPKLSRINFNSCKKQSSCPETRKKIRRIFSPRCRKDPIFTAWMTLSPTWLIRAGLDTSTSFRCRRASPSWDSSWSLDATSSSFMTMEELNFPGKKKPNGPGKRKSKPAGPGKRKKVVDSSGLVSHDDSPLPFSRKPLKYVKILRSAFIPSNLVFDS